VKRSLALAVCSWIFKILKVLVLVGAFSLPNLSSKESCASVAPRSAITAARKSPVARACSEISKNWSIISTLFVMVLISALATFACNLSLFSIA